MRSAGDEGVVDPQPHPDEGADRSFDPGIETGYLRRAARDHELDPGVGAVPFDPGDAAGYDDRRARRETKRRARLERERKGRELEQEELDRSRRAASIADAGAQPLPRGSAAPALDPEPFGRPEPVPR